MHRDIEPERELTDNRTPQRALGTREAANRETSGREASDLSREHNLVRVRGSLYRVSPAELETLCDIGRFRTVAMEDLARFRYRGATHTLRRDLGAMAAQGLVQTRTVWTGPRTKALPVAVLTKLGKELLEGHESARRDAGDGARAREGSQRFFAGFVKPNEIRHDAAIYRMYQAERLKIEKAGGTVRRIVLDYELKQRVYAPLAKARARSPEQYARKQQEVARENGLKVVQGKIPLPDLRLEFETRDGERASVDLELATAHYHAPALQAKAAAGFTFYAADGSGARLSRVLEERDISVAILSL